MSTALEKELSQYHTLGEAAKAAGVSRVTFWKWLKAGKVSAIRVGREVLIRKDALGPIE